MSDPHSGLSAREREIMDIVYRQGEATAASVRADMLDAPTDATVRTTLRILEDKGQLVHRTEAGRFVYRPVRPPSRVRRRALGHVVSTFFAGSAADAVAALVGERGRQLDAADRERIRGLLHSLGEDEPS